MRLAVVGWAADSGVGRELIDAVRHLPVSCAFILQNPAKGSRVDLLRGTPLYLSQPVNMVRQMELFLDCHKPDTVLTWEVPGDWSFPAVWSRKGIRWVHMVHWDWFSADKRHLQIWRQATLLAPNRMCQESLKREFQLDSTLLHVPVDTERLVFRERKTAETFLSVYGYGGMEDRRSMNEIREAWKTIATPPRLLIRAQKPVAEWNGKPAPANMTVDLRNVAEPVDLYAQGDVALQPSRYEGVGVSMLEAQACGLPVIAVDAPPMNEIVCGPRIPVAKTVKIPIMSKALSSYIPSVHGIVDIVSRLKGNDVSELSKQARRWIEGEFSWRSLKAQWVEVLDK